MPRSLVSPEDQKVTFVELFFDLVFVFCVTQVVSLLHEGVTWRAVGESVLIFWLVWWGWTQFTWALNAADTTHPRVEAATLVATGAAFFLAVGIPSAFQGRSLWFAGTYVVVRVIGLLVYDWVAWVNPSQRAAVRLFSAVSVTGLVAVLAGGALGGAWQYALWGLAIVLDLAAAGAGGREEGWNLHPEHFAERHGLFVIIALGESLIVAAIGLSRGEWTGSQVAAAVIAVAGAGALWWSYFAGARTALEHALAGASGSEQSSLARDAFSVLHFPMMLGVIGFAAVVEETLAHPGDPLAIGARATLGAAGVLFVTGLGFALRRGRCRVPVARWLVPPLFAAGIILFPGASALEHLALFVTGVLVLCALEARGRAFEHPAST